MERVEGETIGRRLVREPPPGLPLQMADELAKIHSIPPLDFLPQGEAIARFYDELDSVGEPHPAIEYGLAWVRERLPPPRELTFVHGDFRLGNLAVADRLVAVLDWEFAHVGDPSRTSRGRSCARGGSARTREGSAASATSSRTSSATTS